jgi:hypothetical protein
VSTKAGWENPEPVARTPVLPLAAEVILHRAGRLNAHEIARLDAADRSGAVARIVAWDLLRDALDGDPERRNQRLAARNRAWQQVDLAAMAAGLAEVVDDGYWRVAPQPGAGAARLASFAACALVAPELVDPDLALLLIEPWRSVIG